MQIQHGLTQNLGPQLRSSCVDTKCKFGLASASRESGWGSCAPGESLSEPPGALMSVWSWPPEPKAAATAIANPVTSAPTAFREIITVIASAPTSIPPTVVMVGETRSGDDVSRAAPQAAVGPERHEVETAHRSRDRRVAHRRVRGVSGD